MSELREKFENLTLEGKKITQKALCARALECWNNYCVQKGKIMYRDSVVGIRHTVDASLPGLAYAAANNGTEVSEITEGYREPTVSLQDMDWKLPDKVEYAYYSIYNYYRRHCLSKDIDDWLIVNQALASVQDENIVKTVLTDALP